MTLALDPFSKQYAPLKRAVDRGEFVEAGEIERYEEMRAFVERVVADTLFASRHSTFPKGFMANLPEQKDELIAAITKVIEEGDEAEMKRLRTWVPEM